MVGEGLYAYQVSRLARDLGYTGKVDPSRSTAKEFVFDATAEGKAVPKILRRSRVDHTLADIAPPPAVPQKRKRKAPKKIDV
jgi:hypothetical protein